MPNDGLQNKKESLNLQSIGKLTADSYFYIRYLKQHFEPNWKILLCFIVENFKNLLNCRFNLKFLLKR